MEYTLKRKNGEIVILTEWELNDVYRSAKIAWNKDYVVDLLDWKGFDTESMSYEDIEQITERFLDNVSNLDVIGEIEAETFDTTMEKDFPEFKKNEEDE